MIDEPVEVKAPGEDVEQFASWARYKQIDGITVALYYLPMYGDGFPDRYRLEVGGNSMHSLFSHEYQKQEQAEKAFNMITKKEIGILQEEFDRKHFSKATGLEWQLKGLL